MESKNVILSTIVAILAFFSAQNIHSINLNILFWDYTVSLIILIYVIFFLGVFAGILYNSRKVKKVNTETHDNDEEIDGVKVKKSKKFFKKK